jgi:hypothetical protein
MRWRRTEENIIESFCLSTWKIINCHFYAFILCWIQSTSHRDSNSSEKASSSKFNSISVIKHFLLKHQLSLPLTILRSSCGLSKKIAFHFFPPLFSTFILFIFPTLNQHEHRKIIMTWRWRLLVWIQIHFLLQTCNNKDEIMIRKW